MRLPTHIAKDENKTVETEALLDSGAGGIFIDRDFAIQNDLPLDTLPRMMKAQNVDGTPNKKGMITHSTDIWINIGGRRSKITCLVTGLGKETLILGLPWLRKENPTINWKEGTLCYKKMSSIDDIRRIVAKQRERTKGTPFEQTKPIRRTLTIP